MLHNGEGGIEPAHVHAGALNQGARAELGGANLGSGWWAVHERDVVEGAPVRLCRQPAAVEAVVDVGRAVAVDVWRVISISQGALRWNNLHSLKMFENWTLYNKQFLSVIFGFNLSVAFITSH